MYKADSTGVVTSFPTPNAAGPSSGWFNNAPPGQAGAGSTILDGDFLNAVQAELLNILAAGNVTPNKALTNPSQVLTALTTLFNPGRLLALRAFGTPGTASYVATTGTNKQLLFVLGAGGAGGGAQATGAAQVACGSGGAAGSFGLSYLTSAIQSATITVGAGGTPNSGANGNSGGLSSFGATVSAPGGGGGVCIIGTTSTTAASQQGVPGTAASGSNIIAMYGAAGPSGLLLNNYVASGMGANSIFGAGGGNTSIGAGLSASGYGAGGGGAGIGINTAAQAGGYGVGGLVWVWEFT